jgi:hypothetical protein
MDDERRLQRITAPDYLAGATAAQIRRMRDECRAEERRLSHIRRALHGHLDRLQDELVARDRDDHAAIDEVAGTLGHL